MQPNGALKGRIVGEPHATATTLTLWLAVGTQVCGDDGRPAPHRPVFADSSSRHLMPILIRPLALHAHASHELPLGATTTPWLTRRSSLRRSGGSAPTTVVWTRSGVGRRGRGRQGSSRAPGDRAGGPAGSPRSTARAGGRSWSHTDPSTVRFFHYYTSVAAPCHALPSAPPRPSLRAPPLAAPTPPMTLLDS